MNPKVANIIAVELGILIAILAWLGFACFPAGQSETVAEMRQRPTDSFAPIAPVFRSRNQPSSAVNSGTNSAQAQSDDEDLAPTVQEYDQQLVQQPYAS